MKTTQKKDKQQEMKMKRWLTKKDSDEISNLFVQHLLKHHLFKVLKWYLQQRPNFILFIEKVAIIYQGGSKGWGAIDVTKGTIEQKV